MYLRIKYVNINYILINFVFECKNKVVKLIDIFKMDWNLGWFKIIVLGIFWLCFFGIVFWVGCFFTVWSVWFLIW